MPLGMLFERTIQIFLGERKDTLHIASCVNNPEHRKIYYIKLVKKIKKLIEENDYSCIKKDCLLKNIEGLSKAINKESYNSVEIECRLFILCAIFLDLNLTRTYADEINIQKIKLAGEMAKEGFDFLKIGAVLNISDKEAIHLVKKYKNKFI